MQRFLLLIITVIWVANISAQSPHGKGFKINCIVCHTPEGWKFKNDNAFNHSKTGFPLTGQHKMLPCRQCHTTLVFSEAKNDCAACHKDMHQGTVGRDCQRCHTPQSWVVKNIKQIHREQGFALVGAHASTDCGYCHKSASQLRFDKLNNDCVACHQWQYDATTNPNHRAAGYNTDCYHCHNMVGRNWSASGNGFEHGFFPLTGGHHIACSSCHKGAGIKQKLNPDCKVCHTEAYARAISKVPSHNTVFKSFDCSACHNYDSWYSITFKQHTTSRTKVYSSPHKGK
jgi:hypothetical protein